MSQPAPTNMEEFRKLCEQQQRAEAKYVRLADSRWVTSREILLAKQEADRLAEAVRTFQFSY